MKALVLEEAGEKPRLAVRELPEPPVGPEDVLVKVLACGFCYHDLLVMSDVLRRGVKPRPVLGHEICGEVVGVGERVSGFAPGDRVTPILTTACGVCPRCLAGREHRCLYGRGVGHSVDGGFAELVALPQSCLVKLPADVDPIAASLYACPIGVALRAVRDVADVRPGERVLVTGAGGGLGVHLIQLARLSGASVIAVTSSPAKVERLRALGVDEVLLADQEYLSQLVLGVTGDEGVDVVLNPVGALLFQPCLESLAQYGRMVVLGEVGSGVAEVHLAELLFRDARILTATGATRRDVQDVARLVADARLAPVVSEVLPLESAIEANQRLKARQAFGRIVLRP